MKEFYTAKAVYDLGVSTPKVVEIVKIDDRFGIKSQYRKGDGLGIYRDVFKTDLARFLKDQVVK